MQNYQLTKKNDELHEKASETLANAFSDDPVYKWVLSESNDFQRSIRFLTSMIISMCNSKGEVDTLIENNTVIGVAAWLKPGTFTGLWDSLTSGSVMAPFEIGILGAERAMMLMDYNNTERRRHLGNEPAWYLWHVGILPEFKGKGLLRSLLAPKLKLTETLYLESSNEINFPIYEKLGFEKLKVHTRKDLPLLVPMVRKSEVVTKR